MAANLHLGHNTSLMHQRMVSYVYGSRHGLTIINLDHTLTHLRRACQVAKETARNGGNILFLGTKPMLQKITKDAALRANQFFITHWIGT
jgi:small subunit ribosomal protein S2